MGLGDEDTRMVLHFLALKVMTVVKTVDLVLHSSENVETVEPSGKDCGPRHTGSYYTNTDTDRISL